MLFFSAAQNGFFDDAIHAVRPADCVAITPAEHQAVLAAQCGQGIRRGANGKPEAVPVPMAVLAQDARDQRTRLLTECDWTSVADAPLDAPQKAAWLAYRQALRDVPAQPGFPQTISWPKAPQ